MTPTEIRSASIFALKQRLALVEYSALPHQAIESEDIKRELWQRTLDQCRRNLSRRQSNRKL